MMKKRKVSLYKSLLLGGLVWASSGCAGPSDLSQSADHEVQEETLREVIPLWEAKVADGKEWTTYVHQQLNGIGAELVESAPADTDLFCPNYSNLSDGQKKQYWTFLLSMMVKYESRFNTHAKLTEAFYDQQGKRVISRGLLQISIESSRSYDCGMRNAQELHDPLKNLGCGMRILSRWVKYDGRIAGKVSKAWRGGARYWAVLRSANAPYKAILKASQQLSICRK